MRDMREMAGFFLLWAKQGKSHLVFRHYKASNNRIVAVSISLRFPHRKTYRCLLSQPCLARSSKQATLIQILKMRFAPTPWETLKKKLSFENRPKMTPVSDVHSFTLVAV